jgi:carbamoyltransferase
MKILGITDMQTSGAAVIENNKILAAVNEERLVRKKMARGFPRASIKKVLELSNLKPKDVDAVAIAQVNGFFSNEVIGWEGWFEERKKSQNIHSFFFTVASKYGWMAATIPFLRELFYLVRSPAYIKRRRKIKEVLQNEFNINVPIHYYHHHLCHATAAYYTSGFSDALVVTMDGGGDKHSSHVYSIKNSSFNKINDISAYDSLGNYYAYVTALCGYKAKKHEGKITGLAAYGKPEYLDILKSLITYKNGKTKNIGKVLFNSALKRLKELLPNNFNKEDISSSIQALSEEVTKQYVEHWMKKTGHSNVALAGGIFANVRINEEVHNLPEVKSIFVYPGMSDEGLAVGAAYAHLAEDSNPDLSNNQPVQLPTIYLGQGFSDDEIKASLEKRQLSYTFHDNIEERIAQLLVEGYVVARFNGNMEYGPRALGNRSILYQPNDRSVNDWLNKNLKRTEFMPFAPSVLAEEVDKCFINYKGAEGTGRFMTITFHCTEWMQKNCAGVVHLDNTARPQIVRENDNQSYYKIIKEFHKLTGVPVIINTSFNIHEEPIVCTPDDAIRAFKVGYLDYLAIGNFLVKNNSILNHKLTPFNRIIQRNSR